MDVQIEVWTEYAIGMFVCFLRFFARYKVVGIHGLSLDDLFCFIAMIMFTLVIAMLQLVTNYGSFFGLSAQTAEALTDTQVKSFTIGSKAVFVGWLSYVSYIWAMKASVLCFYARLTLGLWQQKLVKIMAYACLLAYIAVIVFVFSRCTPIQRNWQIKPYAGDNCTQVVPFFVVIAVLNVLTDAGLLAIPLPLIWRVKLPLRRKLIIGLLLCSGIFVIVAALLRCILSILSIDHSVRFGNVAVWTVRETFVLAIIVCAPAIRPLFNKSRWIGSSNDKSSTGQGEFFKFGKNHDLQEITMGGNTVHISRGHDLESGKLWKRDGSESTQSLEIELNNLSGTGSEEDIIKGDGSRKNKALKIDVTTVYSVDEVNLNRE